MDNLIDIGLNLMHSSFKKDRIEIIEEAKKVCVDQFIITVNSIGTFKTTSPQYARPPATAAMA